MGAFILLVVPLTIVAMGFGLWQSVTFAAVTRFRREGTAAFVARRNMDASLLVRQFGAPHLRLGFSYVIVAEPRGISFVNAGLATVCEIPWERIRHLAVDRDPSRPAVVATVDVGDSTVGAALLLRPSTYSGGRANGDLAQNLRSPEDYRRAATELESRRPRG